MKRFMLGSALALACSVGLAAQSAKVKSETKVDVKDGKEVTVTGCVARSASGTAYLLNNVEGKASHRRATSSSATTWTSTSATLSRSRARPATSATTARSK